MNGLTLIQGGGILLTVLLAALFAAWRIRLGIQRDQDIFFLVIGTLGFILLALAQMALLIAGEGAP